MSDKQYSKYMTDLVARNYVLPIILPPFKTPTKEMIAKALVDSPDQVKVSELDGEQSSIIELRVAPDDVGKVIGKQGRNAQAIRTILGAAGMKIKKRISMEIIE